MQVTSKARRRYTIRGSQAAPSGAPLGSKKKGVLTKQMMVTDDGEDVFFKLPQSHIQIYGNTVEITLESTSYINKLFFSPLHCIFTITLQRIDMHC